MVLPDKMIYLIIDRGKGRGPISFKERMQWGKKYLKNVTASQLQLLHVLPTQLLSAEKFWCGTVG